MPEVRDQNVARPDALHRLKAWIVALWDLVLHATALVVLGLCALVAALGVGLGVGVAALLGGRKSGRPQRRRGWTVVGAGA